MNSNKKMIGLASVARHFGALPLFSQLVYKAAETERIVTEISILSGKSHAEVIEFCQSRGYSFQFVLRGIKMCGILDAKAIRDS